MNSNTFEINEIFELLLVGNLTESLIAREKLLSADKNDKLYTQWHLDLVSHLRIFNVSTSAWTQNIDNIICTLFPTMNNEQKFFRGQLREIASLKDRKIFSKEERNNQEDFILSSLLSYFQNKK